MFFASLPVNKSTQTNPAQTSEGGHAQWRTLLASVIRGSGTSRPGTGAAGSASTAHPVL